ncbi:hypothetical protein KP509_29G026900 [Ceratopteris richardii]|uniref:Uncharacterized protein n=1 Tax=Ceratopteris richardii TaxID=49495 RepID=A0A8T2R7G0_CERRI|nr:hypothetical protein KP509_29G026900 [Ceratopteris richardii]
MPCVVELQLVSVSESLRGVLCNYWLLKEDKW